MNQFHPLSEIGRARREEAVARADHHRLVKIAKRHSESEAPSSQRIIVFRWALKIAALSMIVASAGAFFL